LTNKDRDRIIKEWEMRLPDFIKYIEAHIAQGQKPSISPEVVLATSVISLYESSRRIERYSKALFWLTLVLLFLTGVLAVRTVLP